MRAGPNLGPMNRLDLQRKRDSGCDTKLIVEEAMGQVLTCPKEPAIQHELKIPAFWSGSRDAYSVSLCWKLGA